MDPRLQLTRELLQLVLVAALVTAPVFLGVETLDREHVLRVVAANGVVAALCAGLLLVLRKGHGALVRRVLVFGLLGVVGVLSWVNGEDVHVNVVNFVLVTVLTSVLLGRAGLVGVAVPAAILMCGIAAKQASAGRPAELLEARLEAIAQFLPTYAVLVLVLWLRDRQTEAAAGRDA